MNRSRRNNPNSYTTQPDQGGQNNLYNNSKQYQPPGVVKPPVVKPPVVATPPTPTKSILKPTLNKEVRPLVEEPRPKENEKVVEAPVVLPVVAEVNALPEKGDNDPMSHSASTESVEMTDENGGSPRKPFFKKIFGGVRKKPSIRAKERKIRQNRHLRKVILPKNALMALYEIKGIQIGDFIINTNMEGGFTALVTVNNCQYEGTGNSKGNAKTNACEKALRDYIIKKMMQKPRGQSLCEPMDTGESNDATNGDESNLSADETDDVPMVNLASYALYKLFTAWENEGFHVPEFHTCAPPPQAVADNVTKKSVGRNELPPNWEIMHPATLLCIMRPRLTYTDCGNNGDAANPCQTVKVIVDDRQFIGTGRSKKIARKNVAIAVCNTLFGTNFEVDE